MNILNLVPFQLLADGTPVILWFGPQGMPIWVFGPAIVAGIMFFLGNRFRMPALKYIGIIPLVIGLMVGVKGTLDLNDPIYRSFNDITTKRTILFYATWIVPLVAGAGLWFMDFRSKSNAASRL